MKADPRSDHLSNDEDSSSANNGSRDTVLAFLKALRPRGPWVLTAIDPNTQSI
jgi:hypothetical protein